MMSDKFEIIYSEFEQSITKEKITTINLSKTIQNFLKEKGSEINLGKTDENELPMAVAFTQRNVERGFTVSKEFDPLSDENPDFYVIYIELNNLVLGRSKSINLEPLANMIFDWIEEKIEIEIIQNRYKTLEIFQPIKGLSKKESSNWNGIKNFIFSSFNFYSGDHKWEKPYFYMLEKLAKDRRLKKFIPFTSHYRLHLNNEDKSLTWHFIVPSERKEGFIVAEQTAPFGGEEPKINEFFKTLDSAIDFYYKLLMELEEEN